MVVFSQRVGVLSMSLLAGQVKRCDQSRRLPIGATVGSRYCTRA